MVISDNGYPSLTKIPDLSQWAFNQMCGLGDENHNTKLRLLRENARVKRESKQVDLWDFVPYINQLVLEIKLAKEKSLENNQDMLAEIAANFADSF